MAAIAVVNVRLIAKPTTTTTVTLALDWTPVIADMYAQCEKHITSPWEIDLVTVVASTVTRHGQSKLSSYSMRKIDGTFHKYNSSHANVVQS